MKKQASTTHFFYQNGKLVFMKQGGQNRTIFRTADSPLAEQHSTGSNFILTTDSKNSVIRTQEKDDNKNRSFSAYGHDPSMVQSNSRSGFNGEQLEHSIKCYLLGPMHHRIYNPILMRFLSPDNLSPFEDGGINSYCYCLDDPVNRVDPSGQASYFFIRLLKGTLNRLHLRTPSRKANTSHVTPKPLERNNSIVSTQSYASIDSDTSVASTHSSGYAASISSTGSEPSRNFSLPHNFHSVMTNEDTLNNITSHLSGNDMFRLSIAYPESANALANISARNILSTNAPTNRQFGNTRGIMRNIRSIHISTQRPESPAERSVRIMRETVMRELYR